MRRQVGFERGTTARRSAANVARRVVEAVMHIRNRPSRGGRHGIAGLLLCLCGADLQAQEVPRFQRVVAEAPGAGPGGVSFAVQARRGAVPTGRVSRAVLGYPGALPGLDQSSDAGLDGSPVRAIGTDRLVGAAVGFAVGAGVTYAVVHHGGSTSLCDRSANQDALSSGECLGLIVGGGVVGAVAGAFIAGVFRSDARGLLPGDRLGLGITRHDRTKVFLHVSF
jgi:hypothetical protein